MGNTIEEIREKIMQHSYSVEVAVNDHYIQLPLSLDHPRHSPRRYTRLLDN